jgi:regulator of sigma E protease
MDTLFNFLSFLLSFAVVIIPLVFVHELGHFLAARICGVKVEVFAIGIGPRIIGFFDKKGTMWQFSLLPLGGYVKMLGGEAVLDPSAIKNIPPQERKFAFPLQPLLQRAFIVIAGPLANIIFSLIIFVLVFSLHGRYVPAPYNEAGLSAIHQNSPAERAGIKTGDIITHYNNQPIFSFEELRNAIQKSKDLPSPLIVSRGNSSLSLSVTPKKIVRDNQTFYVIGITASQGRLEKDSLFDATKNAALTAYRVSFFIGESLSNFLGVRTTSQSRPSASSEAELAGPLGIASMAREAVQGGIIVLAMTIAIWSINLAIFNLLPIPVLDGGHLALFLIEALTGKPVNPQWQRTLTIIGLSLLIALFLYVTYGDIFRLISP